MTGIIFIAFERMNKFSAFIKFDVMHPKTEVSNHYPASSTPIA